MKPAAMLAAVVVSGIIAALPIVASTNQDPIQQDLTDKHAADAADVDFGHPPVELAPSNPNIVNPPEVTIFKGGTVRYRVNGPGHGVAIYPVSKNTTPEHIQTQLCDGVTPGCSATTERNIFDGDGRLVIVVPPGGQAIRIDYEPGQVLSVGSGAFLIGTSVNPMTNVITPGTLMRVRFEEDGRYLVICMNRAHMVNNWMFGFVNVTTPR
jgi:hypothetical protein